jgi:cell shape-determining protein MreC
MITIFRLFSLLLILAELSIATINGQSSELIVVQAATPANPASTTISRPISPVDSTAVAIKLLQELKAANEETVKKQQAALEQLDELQKAAEQIKIFTKRG